MASAADLDRLTFLAGHWTGAGGEAYEEVWLEPRGGTMSGSFRWVFEDGRTVLEYLVIEASGGEIVFRFKHFNPDFVPWEKDEPNVYRLVSVAGTSATFERISANTRVPKTLIYIREGNILTFRGLGDDPADEPLVLVFRQRN
ncbi:MAG: DUF6265 family protein [Pseudomonadales bacterium]